MISRLRYGDSTDKNTPHVMVGQSTNLEHKKFNKQSKRKSTKNICTLVITIYNVYLKRKWVLNILE
jgi:hypothetical protein